MTTKRTDQENSGIMVSKAHAQGSAPTTSDGAAWTDTSLISTDYTRPSFRNKIINGDFRIAQRGTAEIANSGSVTTYGLDRWAMGVVSTASLYMSRDAGIEGVCAYSMKIRVSGTDTAIDTNDYALVVTSLEGYDMHQFMWGTSTAKTAVLSFWLKSSQTGTMSVAIRNDAINYSIVKTISISTANTWQFYTIYISGPTSGTWNADHNFHTRLSFALMCGATRQTSSTTWGSGNYVARTTQTNFLATTNTTVNIANIQLEQEYLTDFERRPLAIEQELCERYYQQINVPAGVATAIADAGSDTTGWWGVMHLPTAMRTVPAGTFDAGTGNDRWAGGARPDNATYGAISIDNGATGATSLHIISLRLGVASYTAYEGAFISATGAQVINKYVGLSAE